MAKLQQCVGPVAGLIVFAMTAAAQPLSLSDMERITSYARYWGLEGAPAARSAVVRDRLNAGLQQARAEFAGRGPVLAQYFLTHIQAPPSNTAFFFLFRAVGDIDTAMILIPALTNPPIPRGLVLGRDPAEIQLALEAALGNEAVRTSPRVVSALEDLVRLMRTRPGYTRQAYAGVALLGKCRTEEATRFLQTLSRDPNPEIRTAALAALPPSDAAGARAFVRDPDPRVRAQAAEALGRGDPAQGAGVLRASLERDMDPKVIEQTVRALTALRALPQDPEACLRIAARCWEPSTAKPLFDCWRAKAPRAGLLAQATSASWTVRALALEASAETAAFDSATRDRLLRSAAELLSHDLSGVPAPNAVSYSTAQLARNALSQISGRNMAVALEYADRIVPLSGHHTFAGRFGESYDLAAKDPSAYADLRRGPQLLEAGLAALLAAALLAIPRTRRLAVALWAAAGVWCMFTLFETEAAQLPPPPLGYLTATCLALFSGGLTAGCLAATRVPDGRKWQVRRCSPASSRLWYAAGRAWPVVSDRFGRLGAALRSSGMRPARGPVCFCAVVDPGPLEDSDARRRYCPSNWMRSPDSERKRGTSSGLTSSFLR